MRKILCIVSWLLVLCCLVGCGVPAGSDPTQAPTQLITEVPTEDPTEEPSATLEATKMPSPTETKTPSPTTTPKPVQYVPSNVAVGDVVTFGIYEQDKNTVNGKEEIEWIVLDKKDGKALLISKYALDCQPYNTRYTSVTWETCTLRSWLNSTFHTTAFDANQQSVIASTTLTNPDNSSYGTEGGNNTTDKIFLLSIDEAERYFTSDRARQCTVTAYAKEQCIYIEPYNGSVWWLRSPCDDSRGAAYVTYEGAVYYGGVLHVRSHIYHGSNVDDGNTVVRPALWINLES